MASVAAVRSLHDTLDEIATDPMSDPAERVARLRDFRTQLAALVGVADRYIGDQELRREGSAVSRVRQFMEARAGANARGAMLDAGAAPEVLDAAGVLSHDELNRRMADGSIEEVIVGLPTDPALLEAWSQAARDAALLVRRRNAESRGRMEPQTASRRVADARDAVQPRRPAAEELSLDEIERQGLNEWPKPGEAAQHVLHGARDTQELHRAPGAASPGTTGSTGAGTVYTAARRPVHDRIVGQALAKPAEALLGKEHAIAQKLRAGGTLEDDEKATLRTAAAKARGGEAPEALFMGGGSASGKSSAKKKAKDFVPHAAVDIDPDAFKEQLPEYQAMRDAGDRYAAAGTHEESSDLAKRAQSEARELGMNMVIDGTGDSDAARRDEQGNITEPGKFAKKLIAADKDGYRTKALYVTIPTNEAVARSVKRAQKPADEGGGRFVPVPEVQKQHRNVSANFPEIAALPFVHQMKVFDNSGEAPKLIAEGAKGKVNVKDAEAYQAFLDKAKEKHA